MNARANVLALIQDSAGAYLLPTADLEQVLATTTGATHGRKSDDPLVLAVEQLRHVITQVLRARRALDAEQAAAGTPAVRTPASVPPPTTPPGGTKVPRPTPPPAPAPPVYLSARRPALQQQDLL